MKYAGSILYAYKKSRKNKKTDDEKGGCKQKSQIDNEKQEPLQFVSVWLPLISFISTKHDVLSF